MKSYKKSALVLITLFATEIFAQSGGSIGISDARSAAMGNTSVESAFGLYALGNNPANLYWDSGKKVELIIPLPFPRISVSAGTNFLTIDEYNYFFGYKTKDANGKDVGRTLTDADKDRFKNLFTDGGAVTSNASLQIFAIAIRPNDDFGTFSFAINDVISSNVTFPKGIIDLGLDGNLPNRVYNFNDTKMKAWWLRKYSISYARSLNILPILKQVTVGVSFNIISGYAYAGLDHINTELQTGAGNVITGKGDFLAHTAFSPDFNVKYNFDSTYQKKDFKFSFFPKTAGSGLGIDFGLSAKINDAWSVGFALTDIGSVKWNKNAAEYSSYKAIYLDDLFSKSQRDSLVKALTGKDSGKYINEFSTPLATAFRFGVAVQVDKLLNGNFPGRMLLAFDYNQGFNNQPSNSTKPRFSIGEDWLLGVFALRTGFSFGGFDKFNWGMGIGFVFGLLDLNIGTPDMETVVAPNSSKRVTVAIDSRWKF
jgi:hypothetical protein